MNDKTLGAYERHESPDYADGGVTAALIEREADKHDAAHGIDWQSVAEQHEDTIKALVAERDEALYQRDQWMRGSDSWRATLDEAIEERRRIARALGLPESVTVDAMVARIEEVESRPLTPDAITDEMVERAKAELEARAGGDYYPETLEAVLAAALTEPPARPEGAEEIEAILADLPDTMLPATDAGRADLLASRGVRVVGEEDPR